MNISPAGLKHLLSPLLNPRGLKPASVLWGGTASDERDCLRCHEKAIVNDKSGWKC